MVRNDILMAQKNMSSSLPQSMRENVSRFVWILSSRPFLENMRKLHHLLHFKDQQWLFGSFLYRQPPFKSSKEYTLKLLSTLTETPCIYPPNNRFHKTFPKKRIHNIFFQTINASKNVISYLRQITLIELMATFHSSFSRSEPLAHINYQPVHGPCELLKI